MPPLQRYVIALTGGLQDSRAIPEPGDLSELYNFAIFRGRFALRAPAEEVADLSGLGSPADYILDLETHVNKVFILGWDSSAQIVRLFSMDLDGSSLAHEVDVWTSISSQPTAKLTSFSGGTEEAPQDRLYIADYEQNEISKYWVDATSTLTDMEEDWDADGTSTNAVFSLIAPFQFHLWGTGFFEGLTDSTLRPEMLRFSQPGLIEGTDPAGGDNPKEWFTLSHRSVGRRGDKIRALSYARGNFIVFQSRSTHAIFGYGQDSWATKQLSDNVGCVGPHAATETDTGGLCFFWSHDGPYATDGVSVVPLGEDIRQRVIGVEPSSKISAAFSPEDGLVYFIVPKPADPDAPYIYLAYDTINERWAQGSWLRAASTNITVNVARTISSREILLAPGPTSTPSSLSVDANCGTCNPNPDTQKIRLDWTSGDFSLDTVTEIYRDTSSPATTKVLESSTGVKLAYDEDASLAYRTEYFYRIRHLRNGVYSSYSNEDSDTTPCEWLSKLSGSNKRLSAVPHSTGVEVHFNNPLAGGDVRIDRANADQVSTGTINFHENPYAGLSYTEITTETAVASGAGSYVDTSVTSGRKYVYRARVESTGETPGGYSYSEVVTAQYSGGTAPTATASSISVVDSGKGYMRLYASCTVSDFNKDTDELHLYVGFDGSYGSSPDQIYKGNGFWKYNWPCPHPDGYTTVKLKWEVRQSGSQLTDTEETLSVTPCSGVAF